MSRSRKLVAAGAILTIGFALAWPFRHTPDAWEDTVKGVDEIPRAINGDPIASDSEVSEPRPLNLPVAPDQVSARMASIQDQKVGLEANQELAQFDLANHPVLQNQGANQPAKDNAPNPPRVSPSREARPVYEVADREQSIRHPEDWPQAVLHVVRNGDTLEGLAERYLDDAGRGMEIFDLNRDLLSNPHLLPIGVELRIPAPASRQID